MLLVKSSTLKTCLFLLMMVGVFGIAAGCLVLFVNPYDILFKLKIILSDGGEIFQMWKEPPVDLYLRVYLFNVTNREAFLEGREKLKVQEVGPYVYKEHMEHSNITFNRNGTLTSVPLHPLKWAPEMSSGKEDDILILPNIALLSFANVMIDKSYFSQMAVNLLIRQTDSHPLVEMTAKEFMFGYKSTLVTLGNKLLPSWIMFDKLGLIDRMYDFDGDVSTIYTGEVDIKQTGMIATYNRSPKLPQWDMPCGNVKGSSDGTKFPSFVQPNDTLLFFRKSLCRAIPLTRRSNETFRSGLKAYEYTFAENSLDNGVFEKDNKCFCRRGRCLPRGLIDVTDCYYGFPIALSFPHFYQTEERLLTEVEGSTPHPDKHRSYFVVQPESGLPLDVAVRMQINMALGDVSPMSRVEPFKNMVLPLLWTEIRMYGLPLSLSQRFGLYINILPVMQEAAIYMLFIGGVFFVLVSVLKILRGAAEEDIEKTYGCQEKAKSPVYSSRDVISDFIDEGKQVIFGKKKSGTKPVPENGIYRETARKRSSAANIFQFLTRQGSRDKLKRQKTKEQLYDVKNERSGKKEAKPLRPESSTDSETEAIVKPHVNPFYPEDNTEFSETEEKLTKYLEKEGKRGAETDEELPSSSQSEAEAEEVRYQIDISMLDSVKEEIV